MELRQLLSVVTVAETGSVTAAAHELRTVQPAVTRHIRSLEEELGVELFTRTRQGMVLTPAGTGLVERARRALHEVDRARQELRRDPAEISGVVKLGVLESLVGIVVTPLVAAVAAAHPGIDLRLQSAYSGYLQRWVETGDVDLSLLYNHDSTPAMPVLPLVEDSLWLVGSAGAGLRADTPARWAELSGRPLVLPQVGHGLRGLIDRALDETWDIGPEVVAETNSMAVQKQLVFGGSTYTVLPASGVAKEISDGVLSGAPLIEPEVRRTVVLGLPRRMRGVPQVEAVVKLLLLVTQQLTASGEWPARLVVPRGR